LLGTFLGNRDDVHVADSVVPDPPNDIRLVDAVGEADARVLSVDDERVTLGFSPEAP
jgi:hypothetical protein